jgi:hypothetical protein
VRKKALHIVLGLFFPLIAQAESAFSISGKATQSAYFATQSDADENPMLSRSSLWLKPSYSPSETFNTKAEVIFDYDQNNIVDYSRQNQGSITLREGYAQYTFEGFDFRIGRQVYSWGPSDGVNPTDYFGEKDQTYFTFEEDNKRRGIASLNIGFIPESGASPLSFQLVLAPEAPASKLVLPPLASNPAVRIYSSQASQENIFDGINVGGKIKYTGDSWDFGVNAYTGQSTTPEFQILRLNGGVYDVALFHQGMTAAGIESTYTYEKWIFRLESSYKTYKLSKGREEILQPDIVDTVVGIERPFGDHFRTHFQLIIKNALDEISPDLVVGNNFADTLVLQALKTSNNLLLGMDEQVELGGTGRITLTLLDDQLEFQIFALTLNESFLYRPTVKYTLYGKYILTAGAEIYDGKSSTPLGQLKDFSNIFAEVSYLF